MSRPPFRPALDLVASRASPSGRAPAAATSLGRRLAPRRVTATLTLAAGLLVPAAAHAAPADPVVLDAKTPLDAAAFGDTIAWLRPLDVRGTHAQLVVREAGAEPRVLAQTLPANVNDLVIGRDATGARVAILATASTRGGIPVRSTPVRKGALYELPLSGDTAPRRLAVSRPGTDLAAPGLLRGRLSFAKRETLREGVRWTLRRGSTTSSTSTLLSRGTADATIPQTTPVARGRVAYVVSTRDRKTTGASVVLRQVRAGHRSTVLGRTDYGGASESGFGPLTPSAEGGRLTASRWTVAGAHVHDLSTWSLPGGSVVSNAKTARAPQWVVPVVGTGAGTATFEPQGTAQGLTFTPAG
ncbi:hypothetical protein [Patulibacter minatonensis]|uniref:hypothetical protein n=1 Tax=Patulibacter minatonensis TaxID=298163 RepID=UPI00047C012C|nr:hypothetical protein [Patulibacter minatonensis]